MCDSVPDVQVKRNAKKQVRSGKDRAKRPCSLAAKPECLPSALLQNSKNHAQQIGATLGWFLLRHLQRVRVAFDGDFLLAIVLGEIAHHNICRYYSSGRKISGLRDVDYESPNGLPQLEACNAYSLSNATGIPRETVRRKAAELVKRGWIKRDARGGFITQPQASRHFSADFNVRSLADLLETAGVLRKLLENDP